MAKAKKKDDKTPLIPDPPKETPKVNKKADGKGDKKPQSIKISYTDDIITEATIDSCEIMDKGGKLKIGCCSFTPDQYKRLAKVIKDAEPVAVIIRKIQGELFPAQEL